MKLTDTNIKMSCTKYCPNGCCWLTSTRPGMNEFCTQCGSMLEYGCPECGEEIKEDQIFCTLCGIEIFPHINQSTEEIK